MCHHGITAVVHSGITQSHTGTEKMIKLEFLKGRSPLWAFKLTQLIYLNSPYSGSPHALPLHDTHSLLSHINPLCGHPSLCVCACSVRQRCLEEQKRRRQRATRKISTFIGTFMLCFAPYVITRWVVERLGDQRESPCRVCNPWIPPCTPVTDPHIPPLLLPFSLPSASSSHWPELEDEIGWPCDK